MTKWYQSNQTPAVDNLSFEVKDGEIFGFLGPNGAGKSTTIKMVSGILTPNSGSISVCGVDMVRDPVEAKRNIGYVSDNHSVYERLTGLEYLNFMADIYGVSTELRKERIERYLNVFELTDAARRQIKSYSHGMKQKICIAGALVHSPRLWILDEPMTGLDPQSAYHLKTMMRAHCDEGNTVFFSSHVLDVVEKVCDRIGIIDKGRLIAVGTLDELRAQGSSLEQFFLDLTTHAPAAGEEPKQL